MRGWARAVCWLCITFFLCLGCTRASHPAFVESLPWKAGPFLEPAQVEKWLPQVISQALEQDYHGVRIRGENFDYRGNFDDQQWVVQGETKGRSVTLRKKDGTWFYQQEDQPPRPVYREGMGIFSPVQHLQIIQPQITEAKPLVTHHETNARTGMLVSLDQNTVTRTLEEFLGNGTLPVSNVLETIRFHYLIWFDPQTFHLNQMNVVIHYTEQKTKDRYRTIEYRFEESL